MRKDKIAIIGLGYVGLPLARLFATKFPVVGFDINTDRISELMSGVDSTLEVDNETLQSVLIDENSDSNGLFCSNQLDEIKDCNYYIITVPTPVDKNNRPILTPLVKASETVGAVLKKGDIVIYESTVYPGATEEDCVPVLEKVSGLKFNEDFYAGYSPERINPGDKEHTVEKILKVTSASVLPPAFAEVPSFGFVGSCFKTTVNVPEPALPVVTEVSIPIGFPFISVSVFSNVSPAMLDAKKNSCSSPSAFTSKVIFSAGDSVAFSNLRTPVYVVFAVKEPETS